MFYSIGEISAMSKGHREEIRRTCKKYSRNRIGEKKKSSGYFLSAVSSIFKGVASGRK